MLVKVRRGAQLSAAEREFVECLRAYPITCLAAVDLHVGDNGTRQIDTVLLTPRGITVLEVKGFRRRQSGILHVDDDGPWTISDIPADFDDDSATSPSVQVEQAVFVIRNKLERALIDPGDVCGAVVLVPYRGVVVRPARTTVRPGLDVLVANVPDSTELRVYVENFSASARDWTADRVLAAVGALGLDDAPTHADLVADGFAANAVATQAGPQQATQPTPRKRLRPKPKALPTPSVQQPSVRQPTSGQPSIQPPPGRQPPSPQPSNRQSSSQRPSNRQLPSRPPSGRQQSGRQQSGRRQSAGALAVLAVALIGMVLVVGVIVTALMSEDRATSETGVAPPSTSVATTSPARRAPEGCFPFQSGC